MFVLAYLLLLRISITIFVHQALTIATVKGDYSVQYNSSIPKVVCVLSLQRIGNLQLVREYDQLH